MTDLLQEGGGENVNGAVLEARDLSVHFQGIRAIDGASLTLRRDEILGLIGPNGAGKTTLVNVLTGFQRPDLGSVWLSGADVTRRQPFHIARSGVARTFQDVRLFNGLTVFQNVEAGALGMGLKRRAARERADQVLEWLKLSSKAGVRAGALPFGEERRVGIARALAMAPAFLLLDEPAAGLNEKECEDLQEIIAEIRTRLGVGVLLIEHNMAVIMGICTRIYVLDQGRMIAEGKPDEIKANPQVKQAYLGEDLG